jgi:hypothetical protein
MVSDFVFLFVSVVGEVRWALHVALGGASADAETRQHSWDAILTASLISSLCSSVNRLSGFASCPGPWDCVAAGADGGCCVCLGPSGPPKSPGPGLPIPRCLEKDEALKGIAFVLTERSGILVPA